MTDRPTGIANGLTNYGDRDFSLYLRRSFAQSMGYSREMLKKPVVGIAYTPSGFNNCHRHFPELLEAVKRGVLASGGLPLEFPTVSLGEVFLNPTSLKFRNLMAMDTEEMIRAQPMDAVVLMGGCDKTVPAQLMGAVSADRPAIMLLAGPMMTGRHRGERLGACTDCRRFWARYRAGDIDAAEISDVEGQLAVTAGTCAVMGTASTMACLIEALGMCLPGTAAIPAVHADRLRAAEATGAAAVNLIGSALACALWGYFLYTGVIDPFGGIWTLWPLFGTANQMLAAIALTVCTVVLFKMKRERFALVTASARNLPVLTWGIAVMTLLNIT